VQANTLGEVGILGIVLIRVYSGTILPIFIEIGSYLTDKEQKISWHSFSRHGVCAIYMIIHITIYCTLNIYGGGGGGCRHCRTVFIWQLQQKSLSAITFALRMLFICYVTGHHILHAVRGQTSFSLF